MARRLHITPLARSDLVSIVDYGAPIWGERRVDQYIAGIENAMEGLVDFPDMGVARPSLDHKVRTIFAKQHVVIYTVEAERIVVLRVKHQSSGWAELAALDVGLDRPRPT